MRTRLVLIPLLLAACTKARSEDPAPPAPTSAARSASAAAVLTKARSFPSFARLGVAPARAKLSIETGSGTRIARVDDARAWLDFGPSAPPNAIDGALVTMDVA